MVIASPIVQTISTTFFGSTTVSSPSTTFTSTYSIPTTFTATITPDPLLVEIVDPHADNKSSIGDPITLAILSLLVATLLGGLLYWCLRRHRKHEKRDAEAQKQLPTDDDDTENEPPAVLNKTAQQPEPRRSTMPAQDPTNPEQNPTPAQKDVAPPEPSMQPQEPAPPAQQPTTQDPATRQGTKSNDLPPIQEADKALYLSKLDWFVAMGLGLVVFLPVLFCGPQSAMTSIPNFP
ncbi:uncharacterized protein BDR25DRAFT_354481 [Lindgomyces ingoldianus]|uniref:Uncharacterized protein n=1 Tax=Lindgomyces ingoldianus TaxID=673940 RepID=A0ACB6QWH3_9PLEO|nr:uncharacterized protein BDR25DRAFT_354481 [Lindgomyces ingoldianus]KAF2471225.1 hypothetical protein BDR25DRAFT_354481 [Lindgomyces ingoldianus]